MSADNDFESQAQGGIQSYGHNGWLRSWATELNAEENRLLAQALSSGDSEDSALDVAADELEAE